MYCLFTKDNSVEGRDEPWEEDHFYNEEKAEAMETARAVRKQFGANNVKLFHCTAKRAREILEILNHD